MPRLNALGQATMGQGGMPVSVDGRPIGWGRGEAAWDTDLRYLLAQHPQTVDVEHGPWAVYRIRVDGTEPPVLLPMPRNIGAQKLFAGGGRTVVWCGGQPGVYYDTARPDVAQDRYPLAFDRTTGWLADMHYASGSVLKVTDAQGTEVWSDPAELVFPFALNDGLLIYRRKDFRWRVMRFAGVPVDITGACIWGQADIVIPLLYQGDLWFMERGTPGYELRLRRANATTAYVVTPPSETSFSPDAVVLRDGRIAVAWSFTEGEGPTDLRTWAGDPLTLPTTTDIRVPLELPKPPKPTFPAPPSVMPPLWIGCTQGQPNPPTPGNFTWSASFAGDSRPVMEMSPWAATITDRTLLCGMWLSDNNAAPETVDAEIAYAKSRGAFAVYLHQDAANQATNVAQAFVRVRDAGLQALIAENINQGEVLSDGVRAMTLNIRTPGKDLAKLRDGIVQAVEQMRLGRVEVCAVFGWSDRECDWPELKSYLSAVMSRVPTPTRKPGEPEQVITPPIVIPPIEPPIIPGHGHNADPPVKKRRLFKGK